MSLKELKDKICNNDIMSRLLDIMVDSKIHGQQDFYDNYLVKKIEEIKDREYKNMNDTMYDSMDFHCWVVKGDGSIYNPEFKDYNYIKDVWGIDKDEPIILEPFSKELQLECLKTIMDSIKIEEYLRILNNKINEVGNVNDILTYLFVKDPICGKCFCNSWYYKKLYGGKFVIGRMGWRKKDGTVYYEFG